jgi:hypothetical protein
MPGDTHHGITGIINRWPILCPHSRQDRGSVCCAFFRLDDLNPLSIDVGLNLAPPPPKRTIFTGTSISSKIVNVSRKLKATPSRIARITWARV